MNQFKEQPLKQLLGIDCFTVWMFHGGSYFLTYPAVPYDDLAVPDIFPSSTIGSLKNSITMMLIRHFDRCLHFHDQSRPTRDERARFSMSVPLEEDLLGWWLWWAGLGSIQFRNWNCSSIPIPIPELELELKLVELKMELELKTLELELELKTGIEFFAATAAITS